MVVTRLLPRNFVVWTMILVLMFAVYFTYQLASMSMLPFGWNIPNVPFVSCGTNDPGSEQAGQPPTVQDAAYVAGADFASMKDTVGDVKKVWAAMMKAARFAGSVVGFFMSGSKGEPAPKRGTPDAAPRFRFGADTGCGTCPSGTPPAVITAATAARAAGFTGHDLVVAVAVAGAESGYRADAANVSSSARGMWQIMQSAHRDKLVGSWSDPYDSAVVAHRVFVAAGRSWSPWVGYTSGAYRAHLAEAQEVAACSAPASLVSGDMGRTTVDGKSVNVRTARMLHQVDGLLGRPLRVTQGSYTTAVAASGGTHAGGGVVDVEPPAGVSFDAAVAALVRVGFAAWHRLPSQGPWPEHIHAVAIGDPELSSEASAQVSAWQRGEDGLGGTPGQ